MPCQRNNILCAIKKSRRPTEHSENKAIRVCKLILRAKPNSWLIISACGLRAINDNYLQPILYM